MDIDRLIAAVFQRRPIWDKRHKLHSNRNSVDKHWKEISSEINDDETKLRKKWKYLRDQFAVELGKTPTSRGEDGAEGKATSKWPYFAQLSFLKDVVRPRASSRNLYKSAIYPDVESEPAGTSDNMKNGIADDNDEEEQNDDSMESTESTLSAARNKRLRTSDTLDDSLLRIERKKFKYLEKKAAAALASVPEDDNLLFFRSLLPHVRKIPEALVLTFRGRVQDLVNEYAYCTSKK